MRRWMPPAVFATGVLVGAVLWLVGQLTRIAAAACDQPCPTATQIHNSRYFIDVGRALFVVATIALIVWAVRAHIKRQRGRPKRRRPTLREW
jgi:hypothetical protein